MNIQLQYYVTLDNSIRTWW